MALPFAAVLGAQALSAGAGYIGAKKADKKAKEQAQHDAELMKAVTEVQIDSIVAGKEEAEEATKVRMSDISRQAMIERARIITAAGEAGVAGASVSDQMLSSFQQEAESRGRELYNLQSTKRQLSRDITAAEAGLQVRLPRAQKIAPSGFSAIAQFGLQALTTGIDSGAIKIR